MRSRRNSNRFIEWFRWFQLSAMTVSSLKWERMTHFIVIYSCLFPFFPARIWMDLFLLLPPLIHSLHLLSILVSSLVPHHPTLHRQPKGRSVSSLTHTVIREGMGGGGITWWLLCSLVFSAEEKKESHRESHCQNETEQRSKINPGSSWRDQRSYIDYLSMDTGSAIIVPMWMGTRLWRDLRWKDDRLGEGEDEGMRDRGDEWNRRDAGCNSWTVCNNLHL